MDERLVKESKERSFESDLAAERRRADVSLPGVKYRERKCPVGTWELIRITSDEGSHAISRPCGSYRTLNTKRLDLLDYEEVEDAQNEISAALCELFGEKGVLPERILVVGLGNKELTPDSIGPLTASMVKPTMHIKDADAAMFYGLECSEIAVVTPGVCASSGLDSSKTVKGVCEMIKPDAVIAVDALCARSPKRLGTTIQLCDTGIFPGTGLGYGKTAIDEDFIGVPVIAIGVPTVINSRAFCTEGACEDLFVSPKDINVIVNAAAKIISGGINQAFGIEIY